MDTFTKGRLPKVILLGNGVNRVFGSKSWDELLKAMATKDYKDKDIENCPMPLKVILVTGDRVDKSLKSYVKSNRDAAYGKVEKQEHFVILQRLLSLGVDHILTTNYSYELEIAAQKGCGTLSENEIKKLMKHTDRIEQAEKKYLLHTYNEVCHEDKLNRIWHIHGEARKPDSIILGHFYYGELLYRLKEYVRKCGGKYLFCQRNGKEWHIISWIDAFLMGDVYFLGSRLDLSEIDLWWLINRKKREEADHGQIYFYEPKVELEMKRGFDVRLELIKVFAEVKDMGVTIPKDDETDPRIDLEQNRAYVEFYQRAIEDISQKINN